MHMKIYKIKFNFYFNVHSSDLLYCNCNIISFFVINELYTILYSVYHKLLIYLYLQVLKGYLPKGKYFAMVDVLSETQQ